MASILKWFLKALIGVLIDYAVTIYKRIKQLQKSKQQAEKNVKTAQEYEANPTSDGRDNLP